MYPQEMLEFQKKKNKEAFLVFFIFSATNQSNLKESIYLSSHFPPPEMCFSMVPCPGEYHCSQTR